MSETHENDVFIAFLADFPPGSARFRYEQQADVCFQQYPASSGFLLIFLWFCGKYRKYRKFPSGFCSYRNRAFPGEKSARGAMKTSFSCVSDIVVALLSLPTHYSKRKVHLKTRGFSIFWEISIFSIGNPIVMIINGFSIGNQWFFKKIPLNIL